MVNILSREENNFRTIFQSTSIPDRSGRKLESPDVGKCGEEWVGGVGVPVLNSSELLPSFRG